jgi:putative transposase
MKNYQAFFSHPVDGDLLDEIRSSANKGLAMGHDRFKEEIEKLTGRRLKLQRRGGLSVGVRKRMVFNLYMTPLIFF